VDQNIEILNQIAANSPKVEAIFAAINNILNELPDGPSIADVPNRCRQNREGVRAEAKSTAREQVEHVELGLELVSKPFTPERNLKPMVPLDYGESSSLIHPPTYMQNTASGAQDLEAVASPRVENFTGIQNGKEINFGVEESSFVPERPITKYDRDRLYEEVWKTPKKTLACQYGVSDTAIRKACRRLDVPTPPRGHWNKVAAGQPVGQRPELPPLQIPDQRHSRIYSAKERDSIHAQIVGDISNGATLFAACRKSGVMEKTYRRWCRLQLVATPSAGFGMQQPLRAIEPGAVSDPAVQMPCESRPIPCVSAKLLRIHDREGLYREVWSKSMSEIAKEYGVSTPTIGRRCRALHIPTPPPGHWLRVATGLPVQPQPPLPRIQIVEEKRKEWKSNVYPSDEIILISQRISDDVLIGKTQEDACREAGIAITTYRRCRKRLPQPADSLAPAPRSSLVRGNGRTKRHGSHHKAEEIADLDREIKAALQSGKPLHIALREANISQSTYYRWQK
jgi:hypothetical protein